MKKTEVIRWKNLPVKFPTWQTAVIWLLMDRLNASDTVTAVVWTLWSIIWLLLICEFFSQNKVDIFEKIKDKQ